MEIIVLETKWFYRLLKVMYVFFLAVGFIGVLCIGWSLKPYQLVDTQKSYLACPNDTIYSFKSLDLYFYTKESFSDSDVEKAITACNKKTFKKAEIGEKVEKLKKVTDPSLIKLLNSIEHWKTTNGDPYPTHWAFKTYGSWIDAIELWFFGSLAVFLIINVIKQSLLYIVYGKKLTFGFVNKTSKKLMRS